MRTLNKDNYCVILAGGKGRRLWPCSRESKPKQFVDFFSTGRTLLQQTFDRMSKLIPIENIYVNTNHVYAHFVEEQLPELPHGNILSEPTFRNTAPSTAWATYRICHKNAGARIVITPSDMAVFNEESFLDNVERGLCVVAEHDALLAMGVKPTRPEPGYGYIQHGEKCDKDSIFRVKSFTEKPERSFAEMFLKSGEFLWNSGLFLANARYLRHSLKQLFPKVLMEFADKDHVWNPEEEMTYVNENFPAYPNLSIDTGILEMSENVYVMQCDFGWADLGMWHSIYDSMSKNDGDNVSIGGKTMMEDSHGNIIKLPDDHIGIINGLEDFIVAENGNVLLICKREDSSALIKKYISDVQLKYGDTYV
ncbi:MAG: sugar phosphate nucleotidyltransferase [Prevotella sp.]|uniref:mannose-1-phosphate guanylyltransferase n=1 Tax=Prevotella sp. TaxID=59823 RepID=UPI002A2F2F49|nr:sugar phosphate nucleotidyltransferase [Prevotella sp.]MDD7317794.1 sugar phosphate nucleotidyltransferase [Prevotellaceae bacterium]MDY4020709.1 sugar phosphate nucleotidyltransferase [Prevotella sp.]